MKNDEIIKDDNLAILALDENPRIYHKTEIDYKVEQYMSCIANNVTNFLETYNQMVRENGQSIYAELGEKQFASMLGLTFQTYKRQFIDKKFPIKTEAVIRLAVIFGLNPLYILCGKDVFLSHYNNSNSKLDRETFRLLWSKTPKDIVFSQVKSLYGLTFTDVEKLKNFFEWYKENQSSKKDSLKDLYKIFGVKSKNTSNNKTKNRQVVFPENTKINEIQIKDDSKRTSQRKEKAKKEVNKQLSQETLDEIKNDKRKIKYLDEAYIDIVNNKISHSNELPKHNNDISKTELDKISKNNKKKK